VKVAITSVCFLFIAGSSVAQDLEPRAYIRVPVKVNVFTTGFSFSSGGVLTDPNLPLTNLKANVGVWSAGYVRSFSFFGLTAQALAALPFVWLKGSALVNGQEQTGSRSGLGDARLRMSVLLYGAPAYSVRNIPKEIKKTIIGSSLTITAPTGLNYPNKLINIGTRRWAFKPELALSQSLGKRQLLDFYTGVWFFTNNGSFYPGNSMRKQDPVVALQGHYSYTVKANLWVAADATYYVGGTSYVNDISKNDRLSNSRWGITAAIPAGKRSAFKLAFSSGIYIVTGTNFTTGSLGWSYSWF